tara:strand:+ start:140 stop:901 length:762 start_codon:yes stop_codon:yes gene_type:complete
MPNYQNGKVYAIRSNQTTQIYVGSTIQLLSKRLHGHRNNYTLYKKGGGNFTTSFDILQQGDAYIELLELCPCNSKIELLKREGELIRENDCVNRRIAGRTKKEYAKDNKESIKKDKKIYRAENKEYFQEYHKTYAEENKDTLKEYHKTYHEENKDVQNANCRAHYELNKEDLKAKAREYHHNNKEAIAANKKKYRESRKEIAAIKSKEYNETNKLAIRARKSEIILCECGKEICRGALTRHMRTTYHKNNIGL